MRDTSRPLQPRPLSQITPAQRSVQRIAALEAEIEQQNKRLSKLKARLQHIGTVTLMAVDSATATGRRPGRANYAILS